MRTASTNSASRNAQSHPDARVDDLDAIVPVVFDELRRIARRQLRRSGAPVKGDVLCTDELVNEAYMKLSSAAPAVWADRAHFYGVAAHAMRQILVDFARREHAAKRGGGQQMTTLSVRHGAYEIRLDEMIALDEALDRLDAVDERLLRIVEYVFFAGMTHEQVAKLLGISTRTVEREWKKAKLFLYTTLHGDSEAAADAT